MHVRCDLDETDIYIIFILYLLSNFVIYLPNFYSGQTEGRKEECRKEQGWLRMKKIGTDWKRRF